NGCHACENRAHRPALSIIDRLQQPGFHFCHVAACSQLLRMDFIALVDSLIDRFDSSLCFVVGHAGGSKSIVDFKFHGFVLLARSLTHSPPSRPPRLWGKSAPDAAHGENLCGIDLDSAAFLIEKPEPVLL